MRIGARLLGLLWLAQLVALADTPPARRAGSVVHYQFRAPQSIGYQVEFSPAAALAPMRVASTKPAWIRAWPDNGSTHYVEFGTRLVLEVESSLPLVHLLSEHGLVLSRKLNDRFCIVEAPDVRAALTSAQALGQDLRVVACYPIARRPRQLNEPYAPRPNDPFFFRPDELSGDWQANLENRDVNGVRRGVDLNVRAAWPFTRGEGIVLAICDDGVELDHPDLIERTLGAPHFNFVTSETNGMPSGSVAYHATAVAGLAAATGDNHIGMTGVAPAAQLASWVIFDSGDNLVSDELLMDMFQYQSNVVSVQNHSWGKVGTEQLRVSSIENLAISNAVHFGRGGRGVVLVRAAGNGRAPTSVEPGLYDVNEDGYLADPRVIAVAAVRLDGIVTRYSAPGACILVAAPSGDMSADANPCLSDSPNLVSTDRQGASGYNQDTASFGNGDYTFGVQGFSGTSGATPQIAGLVALILSANPTLTYRDVQQVLIHSSHQTDPSDPTLMTNAAGFQVSHNLGFGLPDAGLAVRLARLWSNRPPAITVTSEMTNAVPIPDLGLSLQFQGEGLLDNLRSIPGLPGVGLHPEGSQRQFEVVDVGGATNPISTDLTGKAALIQRGGNFFCEKITFAAQAGAALVLIYNDTGGDTRLIMAGTDLTTIPALFLSQNDGEALRNYMAGAHSLHVQVALTSAKINFTVQETLQCEFVGLNLDTDHTARGDLRIVLTSPSGTRSVLQHVNLDTLPGPSDWTYFSVQNFYESSFGNWNLAVTDENDKGTGSIKSARLIVTGVPITDTDHDGLDDAWEMSHFHSLAFGPADDPDHDGYSNAREQVLGTDPNAVDSSFALDFSVWDSRLGRLSWPSNTNTVYRLETGSDSRSLVASATNLPGAFPQTEWFVPFTNRLHQFFRLEAVPKN